MTRDYASRSSKGRKARQSSKKKKSTKRYSKGKKQEAQKRRLFLKIAALFVIVVALLYLIFFLIDYFLLSKDKPSEPLRPVVVTAKPFGVAKKHPVLLRQMPSAQFVFEKPPQVALATKQSTNGYMLQLGAYSQKDVAFARLKERIIKQGFKLTVVKLYRAGVELYRAELGPYASKAKALQAQAMLERVKIYSVFRRD